MPLDATTRFTADPAGSFVPGFGSCLSTSPTITPMGRTPFCSVISPAKSPASSRAFVAFSKGCLITLGTSKVPAGVPKPAFISCASAASPSPRISSSKSIAPLILRRVSPRTFFLPSSSATFNSISLRIFCPFSYSALSSIKRLSSCASISRKPLLDLSVI
ncbi:hypothetical protein SDC9_199609 [bioreactor metagenome]|uniref:Uncharacterized protein n=1 Tax=bioreactor metagenome TaxID=1076179 RepID=A0A645IKX9_9ZZZZ